MTTDEMLRTFILDELQFVGNPNELTADFPLLESEAIDSLGVYSLVSFCENEFGVLINDEELLPENFATIRAITELVSSKRH
jgi:acyl carrier protein